MWEFIRDHWLYLLVGPFPKGPLGGFAMTLLITAASLAFALPCALAIALCRTSGRRLFTIPTTAFVYTIRGIPLLLLIFWIFFALPVILGFTLSSFATIVIAITVFQSAYLSEVIRFGIEALPKGQTHAAQSLGLGYVLTTWKVILPQALYNVIPGILNNLTAIFKESSLAYAIALHELTYASVQVMNHEMSRAVEIFIILAAVYFFSSFGLSRFARWLERRIERKRTAEALPPFTPARVELAI
jgi:polar amino acid transport system permease protein